jgi:hypothetical protein
MIIIIIKRDIKKVFAKLKAIEHEMFLIDYSSSDDESITRARIVHLNSMSVNFMLNDPTFMTEQKEIEDFASNIAADNDRSMNFMNITTNINEKDSMNIAATISEANLMNFSQDTNEKNVIEENDIIVKKNSIHVE